MPRHASWIAAALAVAVIAAACAGPGGVDPPSPSATQPPTTAAADRTSADEPAGVPEAVVGLGDIGSPRSLNPLLAGSDTAVLDILRPAVGASAYHIAPGGLEVVPELIVDLPSVANGGIVDNGDGTFTVTLQIDPDAIWSDGTSVSGADFVFTAELIGDPSLPIREDVRQRHAALVEGTITADGNTVTFEMSSVVDVELLFPIVVPRHQVEGSDFVEDWNDAMWASAEPFGFSSWLPGEYLELERNPNYWRTDSEGSRLPHLERLVVRFFDADRGVDPRLEAAFRGRELDVVTIPEALRQAAAYESLADRGAAVARAPDPAWYQLSFQFGTANRNEASLNRYLEFRLAVIHALDREALASWLGTSPLDGVLEIFRPELAQAPWAIYEFDLDRVAARLWDLDQLTGTDMFAGDGPRLVLVAPSADDTTVELAGRIVLMLREAGIGAELQLEDSGVFFGRTLDEGTWDVGLWRFPGGAGTPPAVDLIEAFDPDGPPLVGANVLRWGTDGSTVIDATTATYARVVDRVRISSDPAARDQLLSEAERTLAEELVFIPIAAAGEQAVAWWSDELSGPGIHPLAGVLWNVAGWRRLEG